jgi:hypothetical protein
MILGRYAYQQFMDGSVTTLVSGMHAMRSPAKPKPSLA